MHTSRQWLLILAAGLAFLAPELSAQSATAARSSRISRAEIEAALAEAEQVITSPGYSGRIKAAKRHEIAMLQDRLSQGDLQPGDQVILAVQGEKDLTGVFMVGPNRILSLPSIGDVSLKGVLRSELEGFLAGEIRKYLQEPVVHVQTTIRLSILGAVGKPGFYQVASEIMIGDAIMVAGGPAGGIDPAKTRIERSGIEIMTREEFAQALSNGRTVDQLNLRAGDEILVGGDRAIKPGRGALVNVVLPVMTGVLSLSYLLSQLFR